MGTSWAQPHQLPRGAFAGVAGVLALGLAFGLRWFLSPVWVARRRNEREHPSEDSFQTPPDDGGKQLPPTRFPNLTATPPPRAEKLLTVVVPAYNEQDRLPAMLDDTLQYLEQRAQADGSFTYEVLVVDDGSKDNTAGLVQRYAAKHGTDIVRLLRLHTNQGKGAATRKGMLRMRGQYGLLADADAATDIRDLDRLLKALQQAQGPCRGGALTGVHGMGIGSRAHMEKDTVATRALYRTVLMYAFHWCVALLCSRKIKDTQCGFKLFCRDTARVLFASLHLDRWAFDVELVYICDKLGIPMVEVPVNWREVPGSKLITSKWDVIFTSATMLRDMLLVRTCYLLRLWRIALAGGAPARTKSE